MTKIRPKIRRIDTSNSSFRDLRDNQLHYADKTDFIEELVSSVTKKASVIALSLGCPEVYR